MTGREIVLIAVALACIPLLTLTYQRGYSNGHAQAQAEANAAAVVSLTNGLQQYRVAIGEHQLLIEASQHASHLIRSAGDAAAQYNRSTTNELRQLLADTAAERVDCRMDDRIMQHLGAARDRAAAATAGAAPGSSDAGLRPTPRHPSSGD